MDECWMDGIIDCLSTTPGHFCYQCTVCNLRERIAAILAAKPNNIDTNISEVKCLDTVIRNHRRLTH